jgi:hypothetical protein
VVYKKKKKKLPLYFWIFRHFFGEVVERKRIFQKLSVQISFSYLINLFFNEQKIERKERKTFEK